MQENPADGPHDIRLYRTDEHSVEWWQCSQCGPSLWYDGDAQFPQARRAHDAGLWWDFKTGERAGVKLDNPAPVETGLWKAMWEVLEPYTETVLSLDLNNPQDSATMHTLCHALADAAKAHEKNSRWTEAKALLTEMRDAEKLAVQRTEDPEPYIFQGRRHAEPDGYGDRAYRPRTYAERGLDDNGEKLA